MDWRKPVSREVQAAVALCTSVSSYLPYSLEMQAARGLARISMKGGGEAEVVSFRELLKDGDEKQRQGDAEAAVGAYLDALSIPQATLAEASAAFNELAWLLPGPRRRARLRQGPGQR
jgi:hypothetical protein